MGNKEKGKLGEEIAADYLSKKGYKILERNFRFSRLGEVDIVCKTRNGKIAFVEVKARYSMDFGHPFEAITKQKMIKIFKCAQFYLSNCKEPNSGFQIDAVSVILGVNPPKIEHLENLEF